MSKPLPNQNTFANVSPPWNLSQLDANFTATFAAINDLGTYANYLVDTGAVNALVVTPAVGVTVTLAAGLWIDILIANTNTSTTPTLNVGSTGAKTIVDNLANAISAGVLVQGVITRFIYDGSNWRALIDSNFSTGTFTGTFTGFVTNPTCSCQWYKSGAQVLLCINATSGSAVASSNATTLLMSGIPTVIQVPSIPQQFAFTNFGLTDNGSVTNGSILIQNGSGSLTFYKGLSTNSGSWTASGIKGSTNSMNFPYLLL